MRLFRLNIGTSNFHNFVKRRRWREIFKRSREFFRRKYLHNKKRRNRKIQSRRHLIQKLALVSLLMAWFRGLLSLVCLLFLENLAMMLFSTFFLPLSTKFCVKCCWVRLHQFVRLHSSHKWMSREGWQLMRSLFPRADTCIVKQPADNMERKRP